MLDAVSNTGGMLGILFGVLNFVTSAIEESFFYLSIVKKIFLSADEGKADEGKVKVYADAN